MTQAPAGLQIHVHLVDGSIVRCVQPDETLSQKMLDGLRPERLFSQPQLSLVSDDSLTAFPTAAVVRVDFIGRQVPRWSFGERVSRIEEISEEEFRTHLQGEHPFVTTGRFPLAEPLVLFQETALANSERVFSEVHLAPPPDPHTERMPEPTSIDQALVIHRLLSAPVLGCWRRGGDGVILVNPHQVVRIRFFPRPPEAPAGSWETKTIIE